MLAKYRTGINAKVNILDTLNMLQPYLRDADTTVMLLPYLRGADSTVMLSPYLRRADTTMMLTPYLRDADTSTMLLPYLLNADTSNMLSNYRTGINAKVNIADTTNMLANYRSGINAKAPINSPTFTGTVSGIDKTMVGLPNVDNTTDANKPISTATQTALDLKVSLPTTGNVTGNILYWNGTAWVSLTLGTPNQILSVSSGGTLNWSCIVTNTVVNPSTTTTLLESTALTPITIATTGATGIGTATGLPSGVTTWSADLITISGTPSVAGAFTYTIPLTGGCGTVNATGSITVTAFNCGTATVLDGSGNSYNTVAIDNQCWTRENLRTRYYNDNITEIRFDKSGGATGDRPWNTHTWSGSGLDYGAYTLYAHDSTGTSSNLSIYGYLYNWYAVAGIITNHGPSTKNICPVGWHVPSDAEFTTLTTFLGGESVAGGKMKST
jgi:hypothetical protein